MKIFFLILSTFFVGFSSPSFAQKRSSRSSSSNALMWAAAGFFAYRALSGNNGNNPAQSTSQNAPQEPPIDHHIFGLDTSIEMLDPLTLTVSNAVSGIATALVPLNDGQYCHATLSNFYGSKDDAQVTLPAGEARDVTYTDVSAQKEMSSLKPEILYMAKPSPLADECRKLVEDTDNHSSTVAVDDKTDSSKWGTFQSPKMSTFDKDLFKKKCTDESFRLEFVLKTKMGQPLYFDCAMISNDPVEMKKALSSAFKITATDPRPTSPGKLNSSVDQKNSSPAKNFRIVVA